MEPLVDLLKLSATERMVLVGSGGKTTLLFQLAQNLGENHPVLIGTTTQMFYPDPKDVEVDWVDENLLEKKPTANGRYLVGHRNPETGKLHAPASGLQALSSAFPYTLLEGDGSKMRPLKGWAPYEPVIPSFTTLTLGVTTVSAVGQVATEDNVHRLAQFTALTGCQKGEVITLQHLAKTIAHPQGLFGKGLGKLVLFVTQCDTIKEIKQAQNLVQLLPTSFVSTLWGALGGSGQKLQGIDLRKVTYGDK